MRQWTLGHDKDGYVVTVYDVPRWAHMLERFGSHVLCPLTGHCLCGASPEFFWSIPLWPGRSHEGDYTHSLGEALYNIGTWFGLPAWHRNTTITQIRVTDEQGAAISPEFAEVMSDYDPLAVLDPGA